MSPDLSPYEFFVGGTILVISVFILGAYLKARKNRRSQVQYIVTYPNQEVSPRKSNSTPLFNFLLICALAFLVYIITKEDQPTPSVTLQPLNEMSTPSLNSMDLLEDENGVVYTAPTTE
ncbi:MAG: hypothetical protein AAFU67_14595 [Bacteroidota bacterium]